MKQEHVEEHFDEVAKNYDYWKSKNWYYYQTLQDIANRHTKGSTSVMDAGCGTGTILNGVNAPRRVGVDISTQMIEIAKKRYGSSGIEFSQGNISDLNMGQFDAVLFFDVIEHVENAPEIFKGLSRLLSPSGVLIISMANPLWEGILMVAEKLKMKMPEGPHYRMPASKMIGIARDSGLELHKREWRLLFPKHIPVFSYIVNDIIGKIPLLERLACIEVFVFKKK